MNIQRKLITGFFTFTLLICVVGYFGFQTARIIEEQSSIKDGSRNLILNIVEDSNALEKYLLSDDPVELAQIRESIEKFDELTEMWISALKFGTDSAEFRSKDSYKTWVNSGFEEQRIEVTHDFRLGDKIDEIEEIREEYEEVYEKTLDIHDTKVTIKAKFNENIKKHSMISQEIENNIEKINNSNLNMDLIVLHHNADEVIYHHKDRQHIEAWFDSIDTLRDDIEGIGDIITLEEKSNILKSFDEYYSLVQETGDLVLEIEQLEKYESEQYYLIKGIVTEIDKKRDEIEISVGDTTDKEINRSIIILIGTLFSSVIFGLFTAFVISSSILNQIGKVTKAALEIGEGNFEKRIDIETKDEIGQLSQTFNEMTAKLSQSYKLLKDEKKRLKTILDTMPNGVMIIDSESHRIVEVNPLAQELIGAPWDEIVGKVCHWFICPAVKGACPISDLGQKVDKSERILLGSDGRKVPILKTVIPIQLDGKEHFIESIIDITEQKKAAEEIKKFSDELEESNRMKDLFGDIMHHDLLNPIGTSKVAIEFLLEEETDPTKIKDLEIVLRNINRMIDLIENANKLSKLGSSEYIEFENMDLKNVIEEVIEGFHTSANLAGMEIEFNEVNNMPIQANRIIGEVFSNLISNAIKYAPGGKKILVKTEDRESFWRIKVIDFGTGIEDKDKIDIFERFQRLFKHEVKGSGLGLAIVKMILEIHKGKVWVEDNILEYCDEKGENHGKKQGAVFVVEIPKSN